MTRAPGVVATNGRMRFWLDGHLIELEHVDPTRTVLQFLREDLCRKGTKEGCAEGDCGACMVVLAELDGQGERLVVSAVNSCIQFLPTLDGKELITVESLTADGAGLHPVQQAMVECHGSQCGFCTPGIVMSLFALYKNQQRPSRRDIDDALAGNLCRCTGYRPIVAAASAMYDIQVSADDWLRRPGEIAQGCEDRVKRLRELERRDSLALESGGRRFFAPRTLDELVHLVAEHPDATLLAGGTDVALWVTKQHAQLDTLIHLGAVQGLADVRVLDGRIEIGAAATLELAAPVILAHHPLLHEVLRRFASPPIRNVATLAGNIANGSPVGDLIPVLMAADASLVLRSTGGARELPLDSFYDAPRDQRLARGEFIERIHFPLARRGAALRCYKVSKRYDQDIAAVCVAVLLELDAGHVCSIRIAFGGMAAAVRRAPSCEAALIGQTWDAPTVERAMAVVPRDFEPITDLRGTAAYRMRTAQNLLWRLYLETQGELGESIHAYGRHD